MHLIKRLERPEKNNRIIDLITNMCIEMISVILAVLLPLSFRKE